MKKSLRVLFCLLLVVAMVAGCGQKAADTPTTDQPAQEADKPAENQGGMTETAPPEAQYAEHMEVIIDNTTIAAINPIGSGGPGSATGWVYRMVYDRLVDWDESGAYLPCLATSWESEDWKTVTFHLRDDVYFSNGEKFTAADVVFTIEAGKANPGSVADGQWKSVVSATAVDDYTLVLELESVRPQILYDASSPLGAIMCKSAVEADPDKGVWVGTGPYVITDFATNDYVSVERNDNYWGELPPTKTMTLRYIPEMATRLMMLQNGEADICFNLSEQDLALIAAEPENYTMYEYLANNCSDIGFNMNDPICGDYNFRMAVAHALNRTDIALGAAGIYATPETTGTFWGSGTPFRNNDIPIIEYDLDKAKDYLAKSPYNGETIELITAIPTMINASAVIQQQLAEVGIKVEIKQTDPASLMSTCVYGSSDFQMYAFVGAFQFEPYSTTYGIFAPKAMQNRVTYDNPEIMAILEKAASEADTAKQQEYYYEIQELVAKDIPYLNLFYVNQAISAVKSVGGLKIVNDGSHDLRYMYKLVD